jgi:hypothetical protein
MKSTTFALLLLLPGGILSAQSSYHQAPSKVQQSFHRDYPGVNDEHWQHTNGKWQAQFTDRGSEDRGEMVAHYDQYGHHVESHIPYDRSDVPAAVSDRAQHKYHGGKDYRYTRVERPGHPDLFQIHVNIGGKTHISYVDENGRDRSY